MAESALENTGENGGDRLVPRKLLRRVDPAAEGDRFDEFTAYFPADVSHRQIGLLWGLLRGPMRHPATKLLRAGTTETDYDGFPQFRANKFGIISRQDSVNEINEEVAEHQGDVFLFRVGITNGGGLNAAIGASEADDVLNAVKTDLEKVLSQEFGLEDADVTLLSDGPAMIVLTKTKNLEGLGDSSLIRSQLLASIYTSTSTALTQVLSEKKLSAQLCQPEVVNLSAEYKPSAKASIKGGGQLPLGVKMQGATGFVELVGKQFDIVGVDQILQKRGHIKGFEQIGRGYASLNVNKNKYLSNISTYGYPSQRAESLLSKMQNAGLQHGLAAYLFHRFGQFARDEVTGGLGRVSREAFIKYEIENDSEGYESVYVELDIGNLGALNKAVGLKHADQIFGEIATLCRLKLEQSGLEANMIRHGGDEFSFIGRVPKGAMEQFEAAVADLQPLVQRYVDALPEFENLEGERVRVPEIRHAKEDKHATEFKNNHKAEDYGNYRAIRSKGVGVTVAWSKIDCSDRDPRQASEILKKVSNEIEVSKELGHEIYDEEILGVLAEQEIAEKPGSSKFVEDRKPSFRPWLDSDRHTSPPGALEGASRVDTPGKTPDLRRQSGPRPGLF